MRRVGQNLNLDIKINFKQEHIFLSQSSNKSRWINTRQVTDDADLMVVSTAIEKSSESAVVLLLIGGDVDLAVLLIWQGLHLIRTLYLSSLVEVKYRPPYFQIRSYRIKASTVYCYCTLSQGVIPLHLLSVKVKLASENCI